MRAIGVEMVDIEGVANQLHQRGNQNEISKDQDCCFEDVQTCSQ